jgi:hypothetical protein
MRRSACVPVTLWAPGSVRGQYTRMQRLEHAGRLPTPNPSDAACSHSAESPAPRACRALVYKTSRVVAGLTKHTVLLQNTTLKRFYLFYTLPILSQVARKTDLQRNVGCCQYLTPLSVFLIAPAADIA